MKQSVIAECWVCEIKKATVVHVGDVPAGPKLNHRVHWLSSLRNRFLGRG